MHLNRRTKRRAFVLLILTLVAALAATSFRTIQLVQRNRMLAQARSDGMARYQAGDLDQALSKLRYVFEHQADDLELNKTLAELRARLPLPDGRHLQEAVDYYTKHGLSLLDRDDSHPDRQRQRLEILDRLLKLYGQLGMRYELAQTANRILAVDPDSVNALAAKAEVLYLDRSFDEAEALCDRLIGLEADNLNWRRLMLDIQRGGGAPPAERLEQCRAWAQDYEGDGRFHLLTAGMLVEMDRLEEARAELEQLAHRGADTREVLQRAVSLLDLMELGDQANTLLATTQQRFLDQAWVREVSVSRLWRANRVDHALAELEQAARDLGQLNPELLRLRVLALIAAKQGDQAREALAPLLSGRRDQGPGMRDQYEPWSLIPDPSGEVDRAWALAVDAALDPDQGNWRSGVQAIGKALVLSPNDPVLHFLMGDACLRVGEQSQAMFSYQTAYELDPDWMAAGIAYGEALLSAGRINDAYNISRMVVSRAARDRVSPLILYARAHLALREVGGGSQLAAADAELDRQVIQLLEHINRELPDDAQIMPLLAQAYIQAGLRENAANLMAAALGSENAQEDLLLGLAELSLRRNLGMAEALLDRAKAVGAAGIPVALLQARVSAANGASEAGLELIDQALRSATLEEAQLRRARCARVAFMLETNLPALEALESLVDSHPDSADVQRFVLSQSAAWSDPDLIARAMTNFREILGDQSQQVRLAEANFFIRHHATNHALLEKAIARITTVLEQSPDSLAALSLMAEASLLGERPDVDGAIESLHRAVSLYPGEPSLVLRLIALLQDRGEYDRAGHHLRALARLSTLHPQLQPAELRLLQAQGDFEAALVRAAAIVTEASPPPDQLVLAAIHQGAGNLEAAEAIYQRLLETPEPEPFVLAQAAEFFASTARFERGLDLLGQIQKGMSDQGLGITSSLIPKPSSEKEVLIGSFYQRHGRPDQAGDWLRRAVLSNPQSVQAHDELARYYLSQHDRLRAREQAVAGLRIDPKHSGLRTTLALASLDPSSSDDGRASRKQAIELLRDRNSENDDLLATLLLLDEVPVQDGKPRPTPENLADAARLIEEHGQFLPSWLLAISLHIDAGREADAIPMSRSAVSRFPNRAEPAQWATQLLMQSQRWNEALVEAQEWRRRSLNQPIQADVVIASILLQLNRAQEAVKQLESHADELLAMRDQTPDHFAVWLRTLAWSGQYDRAESLIRPLLSEHVQWRRHWLAIADGISSEAPDALSLLDSIVDDPEECLMLAQAWTKLASAGGASNQSEFFDRARLFAIKAGRNERYAAQSHIAQGAIAETQGDWEAAEIHYRRAREHEPDNHAVLNNLAYVLAQSPPRCPEALTLIQKAMQLQPNQPDLLDTYAQVLRGLDRLEEAEQALKQALSSRPDDLGIALHLAELHIHQDRYDEVERQLDDLQRRIRSEVRPDPGYQRRIDSLREQLRSSPVAANINMTSSESPHRNAATDRNGGLDP